MRLRLLQAMALIGVTMAGCVQQPAPDVQFGTLLAAAPALQEGESTGAGAAASLVLGVAGGAALGRGAGQVIGAAIGGALGGTAGSAAENAAQGTSGMAYTVRLDGGQVLTVIQHVDADDAMLQPGARVRLRIAGRKQRVEAASGTGHDPAAPSK